MPTMGGEAQNRPEAIGVQSGKDPRYFGKHFGGDYIILIVLGPEISSWMVGILGGLALVGIAIGVVGFLVLVVPFLYAIVAAVRLTRRLPRFLRSTFQLTCPGCAVHHELFNDVDLYTCPQCTAALVLGPEPRNAEPLFLGLCPYCERRIGARKDHGNLDCGNCRASLIIRGATILAHWQTTSCPTCSTSIPSSAAFWATCHALMDRECIQVTNSLLSMLDSSSPDTLTMSMDKGTGRALAALLWHDGYGMLADARTRIARIQNFNLQDWNSLETYFKAHQVGLSQSRTRYLPRPEEGLFFAEVLSCSDEQKLQDRACEIVRAADERHALALEGVVSRLQADNILPIEQMRSIEVTYLSARGVFLSKLSWAHPTFATRFDVVEVRFSNYPKEAKRGIVANTAFLTEGASRLRTSGKAEAPGQRVALTDGVFDQSVLNAPGPVLVLFGNPFLFREMSQTVDAIAADYAGKVTVGKLNMEDNPVTTTRYGVSNYPTLLLFKRGQVIEQHVGKMPKPEVVKMIVPHIS